MATATQPFVGTFTSDPIHSSFGFAARYMGVSTFRGTFDDVTATLVAGDDGVRLEGTAKAESISIRTPEQFRAHVLSAEFFDVANHAELTFRSTRVDFAEDGTVTAEGDLTIKGITRPVVAKGTYTAPSGDAFGNTRGHLTLETTINRRDYEFNWDAPLPNGGSALADDIVISVDISLVAQA